MDRLHALEELATSHAVAVRLADDGAGEEQIAVALGIPPEAAGTLLRVARAKLEALLAGERDHEPSRSRGAEQHRP